MTAQRVLRDDCEVGCVVSRETGLVVVLTDDGPVRATYSAGMLSRIARDRSGVPGLGEWVSLRRWSDGPVTVVECLARRDPPLATVLPFCRRRTH